MKRMLTLLVSVLLCVSLVLPAYALSYGSDIDPESKEYEQIFWDIPRNHWAFQYISELVAYGAISGFPDGNYYPDTTVTRVQFAKIMVMAAGLNPTTVTSTGFSDLPANHWGAPYVVAAKPYMTAYIQNDGRYAFKPDQPALREDIAVAVVKLKGYDTSLADLSLLQVMFSDYDSISAAVRPYIATAIEHGVISGYPDGTFRGQAKVTRAEAAAILWRAFQMGGDNKVLPGEENEQKDSMQQPSHKPATGNASDKVQTNQKQNVVETLASIPAAVDDYTFTQNGDVYYIKNNKLYQISGGRTTELFDGNTDFYEEVILGDLVAALLDGPEEFYWSGIDGCAGSEKILYFDQLTLKQLGYDQSEDSVYVFTESNLQYAFQATFYFHSIYNVKDLSEPIFTAAFGVSGDFIPQHGMICGNGVLIYSDYTAGDWAVDSKSGMATKYGRRLFDQEHSTYANVGGKLYSFGGWWGYSLSTWNLNTGAWENMNLADNGITKASAVTTCDEKIFFASSDGIYRMDAAGTNRLKSVLMLSWSDLTIQDGAPMGEISDFLLDQDGNILFLDASQMRLRKITVGERT